MTFYGYTDMERESNYRAEQEAIARAMAPLAPIFRAPPPLPQPPAATPAQLHELTVGARLVAGLSWSTVLPDLDFECYSEAGYFWNPEKKKFDGPPKSVQNKKGLPVIGAANYAQHPSTEVLCLAYNLKDGLGKRHWRPGLPPPMDLFLWIARGGLLEAWNCGFERYIWEYVCVRKMGWPAVHSRQWRDAMAKARASSWPGALGDAGRAMHLTVQKDAEGTRLLNKFCMPRNPTKADPRKRILPTLDPAHEDYLDTLKLYNYNFTDIESEAEASSRCPDLEGEELEWWFEDQEINVRGVKIDKVGLENCIALIEACHERYNGELCAITGIDSAGKLEQIKGWLAGYGVYMDEMDEDAIDARLKIDGKLVAAMHGEWAKGLPYYGVPPMPEACRRVLEIRGLVGSAAVKKVFAMRNRLDDRDRLNDLFIYYGARTGRVTGDGPQPTNMPSGGPKVYRCAPNDDRGLKDLPCGRYFGTHTNVCPWCAIPGPPDRRKRDWNPRAVEDALRVAATRDVHTMQHYFGDAMHAVSGCIRGLFIPADGCDFISSDYSSIEAVGLAMIAGEKWRIDVFRTHGKIYETSASRMFKVPFEEMMACKGWTPEQLARDKWWEQDEPNPDADHHELRKKGKIGELAFGYQGWLGAAKAFDMPGEDDEIKADILAWRAVSPAIEWLWGGQTKGKANGILQNAGWSMQGDRWDKTPEFFGCEGAAIQAILNEGTPYQVIRLDNTFAGITYLKRGRALYCQLPSGRWLTYHNVSVSPSQRPNRENELVISYEGWNTNPNNGGRGWITMDTWGGRLVENIVQATCRDILRFAVLNLRAAGYRTVLHIYDEIVAEVAEWFGSTEHFEVVMAAPPPWAIDWPIKAAGGWRGKRYRKG